MTKNREYSRMLLLTTALLFSMLTCAAQEDTPASLEGTWTKLFNERTVSFILTADSTFQVDFVGDAEMDVWGSYQVSGTQVTFTDEGGAYSSEEAGVYEFSLTDEALTFTQEDDPVYGRRLLMEGSWSKKGS